MKNIMFETCSCTKLRMPGIVQEKSNQSVPGNYFLQDQNLNMYEIYICDWSKLIPVTPKRLKPAKTQIHKPLAFLKTVFIHADGS